MSPKAAGPHVHRAFRLWGIANGAPRELRELRQLGEKDGKLKRLVRI